MDLIVFSLVLYVMFLFVLDSKFKSIEKKNQQTIKRLDAIIKHLTIKYPSSYQLSDKIIELKKQDDYAPACKLIMEEFGCSYEEANTAISNWHEDIKNK